MPPKSGIVWIKPPSSLARAVEKYGDRALVAAHALAVHFGGLMQNDARRNAPWEDRTGNARGGLFFAIDGFGQPGEEGDREVKDAAAFRRDQVIEHGPGGDKNTLVIVLGHTMSYGVSLELEHGERYAIIWPTMEEYLPRFKKALKDLFD